MAKVASKGSILLQELSGVYTAVAQLTDIGYSGGESETYDQTCLDSGVGKIYGQTGYSEGGEVTLSGFYDPALSGHQAITDLITTPADQNWRVTLADAATTDFDFSGAGVSFEYTVAMADGLKFSSTIKVDGLPTYPT
jgi:hypothetical protein